METLHVVPRELAKASAGAAIAAALVLTLFVLPAEAGIDPTGVGSFVGLTGMSKAAAAEPATPAPPRAAATAIPDRASIEQKTALRSDEMEISLPPHQGAEIKAHMQAGDHMIFRWESSGGPVKVDMHGEPPNAGDEEFTSYWEERQLSSAQGSFTAPFTGKHGWYWRNKGETPVTVKLRTSGFYQDLFRPHAE